MQNVSLGKLQLQSLAVLSARWVRKGEFGTRCTKSKGNGYPEKKGGEIPSNFILFLFYM